MAKSKTCKRMKTVYSPARGKRVKVCADFGGIKSGGRKRAKSKAKR